MGVLKRVFKNELLTKNCLYLYYTGLTNPIRYSYEKRKQPQGAQASSRPGRVIDHSAERSD